MVQCVDGSYYTGITTSLERRLKQHNGQVRGGAAYTRSRTPVVLVYNEACDSRSDALKREYCIKHMSHGEKQVLAERKH